MNILFLALDIDLAGMRGDAVHVRELVGSLAARGNQVDLVTATHGRSVSNLGANIRHHIRPEAGDLTVVRACAEIAREAEASIIYERRLSPKIAFGVSRLTGLPFVVEVNGIEEEAAMQGRGRKSAASPLKGRARSAMFRRARRVVAVTEALADVVRTRHRIPSERVVAVPNGVDPERFRPIDPTQAQKSLGWSGGDWIVFVGNLVAWQGVEFLLQAAPRVFETHPSARIGIVGDGISRPSLENLAARSGFAERITFTGTVPHESVPLCIGAAAICVAPFTRARNEAIGVSPLKLFEYLACGRPVVASDVPGIQAVLEASGGGIAVPPEDVAALADAVDHMLDNPDGARAMGQRGREYAAAECSWSRTAERVERVLREAVSGKTPTRPGRA